VVLAAAVAGGIDATSKQPSATTGTTPGTATHRPGVLSSTPAPKRLARRLGTPSQELAVLLADHAAMASPSTSAVREQEVSDVRPITGERTVLPVLASRTTAKGIKWFDVRLPGRPNGRTGWILQRKTFAEMTNWRIVVDTTTRQVLVYDGGAIAKNYLAIVGSAAAPTPIGQFFVEEDVELVSTAPGARLFRTVASA
jgi:hypothetical protein